MHALSELNKEFQARGFYEKQTGRILLELALMVTMTFGGIAAMLAFDSWLVKIFAFWVSSLGLLGVATNTHTSAHYATSNKWWVNWALQIFGYSVVCGVSATYFRHKHVVVHHPTSNVVGLDDDIDLLPWFGLNEREWAEAKGLRRVWYRYQWVVVPLAICLNSLNLQMTGYRFLWRALRNPKERRGVHWADLAGIGVYYVGFIVVPAMFFPLTSVIGFHLLRQFAAGWAIFLAFAPAHFPSEAIFLSKGDLDRATFLRNRDFILLQCATTVNIRTTRFGNLICAGVDYQIEHHLFPGISHTHHRAMAPIVKRWCEQHGYPYRSVGLAEGFFKSWMAFRTPRPVVDTAEVARLPMATDQQEIISQAHLADAKMLGGDPKTELADYTA